MRRWGLAFSVVSAAVCITTASHTQSPIEPAEATAMREAVAAHIHQWTTTSPSLTRFRIVLDTRPDRGWFDTQAHDELDHAPTRSGNELERLARIVNGRFAADSELVSCGSPRTKPCAGDADFLKVSIGEPHRSADSVAVAYGTQFGNRRGLLPRTTTIHVAFLRRGPGGWTVSSVREGLLGRS